MTLIPSNIIVNADDFGYSDNVNEAIVQAFETGYINQTTLMVNMPSAIKAVELARKNGFVDKVGLHLNLTEGYPLTVGLRNCAFFCEDGRFKGNIRSIVRTKIPKAALSLLREEIRAQIKLYLEYGLTLRHIDSHHHVHTEFAIFRLIESVFSMEKTDFNSMRIARNLCPHTLKDFHKRIYKTILNKAIRNRHTTSDLFGSYNDFVKFRTNISNSRTCEIMVHPVLDNGILVDKTDGGKLVKIPNNYEYGRK